MKKPLLALSVAAPLLLSTAASATPSTTFWAPSTTSTQPYLVPHITFDTYFAKGPAPATGVIGSAGTENSPIYPVTVGLTVGVLPWERLQLELGFDLLLPTTDPLLFNAKLGTPEGSLFSGSPGLAVGMFGVGTKAGATDYALLYGQIQKDLPWGGYVSAGGYYGAGSTNLWTSSGGDDNRAGFMGAVSGPAIDLELPGLKKIIPVADIQTGENVVGAVGGGLYVYFTDAIDLLTGPVFFFDKSLQPGGRGFMWSVQLDIDVGLCAGDSEPGTP